MTAQEKKDRALTGSAEGRREGMTGQEKKERAAASQEKKKRTVTAEETARLCETAVSMREKSYVPYSHFRVGAALLGEDGRIYTGCNIENAAFTPTVCAERTAIFKAVSEGTRSFLAIAIAGGPEGGDLQYCAPCGVCRQVMQEFCPKDFPIYLARSGQDYRKYTLGELLPEGFGNTNLKG